LLKQFAKRQRATVLNERLASELTSAITTPADVQLRDQVLDALSQLSISDREIVQLSAWEELARTKLLLFSESPTMQRAFASIEPNNALP